MTFINAASSINRQPQFTNMNTHYQSYSQSQNAWPTIETGAKMGVIYSVARSLLSLSALGLVSMFGPSTHRKVVKIALDRGLNMAKIYTLKPLTFNRIVSQALASGLTNVIHKSILGGFLGYSFYQLQKSSSGQGIFNPNYY